jgi:hypothetical protein
MVENYVKKVILYEKIGKVAKGKPFKKNKIVPLCSKSFMLMELEIKRS